MNEEVIFAVLFVKYLYSSIVIGFSITNWSFLLHKNTYGQIDRFVKLRARLTYLGTSYFVAV